jgi:GT2 family glycosyltransferase
MQPSSEPAIPGRPATGADATGGHPPTVSVIIPHRDDLDRLMTLMRALAAQSLPAHEMQIIVGDNGSRAGFEVVRAAVAAIVPGASLVHVPEPGAGPARNGAMAKARGRVLAFIDSDCVPDPDWLAQGLAATECADLAGGAMIVTARDPASPSGAEAFEQVFAFDNARYVRELGFSVTANLFARREVLEAIGDFRDGVPEDLDWCRRAKAAGFRLAYAPGAVVSHPARHDFTALSGKWRRLTDEAFADWCDRGGSRLGWIARAVAVLASALLHAPSLAASPRIAGAATRFAALGVLVGIRALRACWMLAQALENKRRPTAPVLRPAPSHAASE